MRALFIAFLLLTGCVTSKSDNPRKISEQRQLVRDQLSGEISLKQDRHELDELRKEVPKEKKEANDELAFSLNQTADLKEEPSKIRQRFQNLVERKRRRFNEKVQKIRNKYQTDETRRRDDFFRDQNEKRDKFRAAKRSTRDSNDFYSQQDRDRLEFFAREREKRADFDDEILQQTKDFNEYMKMKHDEFTEQMRNYTQRFDQMRKEKGATKAKPSAGSGSADPSSEENPKLPEGPYDN